MLREAKASRYNAVGALVLRFPALSFVRNSFSAVPHPATSETESDLPPLLPSWRAWYWLVLGALALEIGLFVYLTRAFA